MFRKILIANRGEIACRVARTAARMDIRTVAVYSDPDRKAMHVSSCDESWPLGGATAQESYLDMDRIIDIARQAGCQAIHPGYGFLSENAQFVEKCDEAGIVFIGPGAESIRQMGSKSAARLMAAKAGVPVLPGYDGTEQDPEFLLQSAIECGFPLLIKAVSGGGGKGMRVVEEESTFTEALESVKRESLASFGDDRVLLERYLPETRHVEVQVFADQNGNAVHLFERDCSMQRRHQKVIEESPAPGLQEHTRDLMTSAALDFVRSMGYLGAGTVEFLLAPDNSFYFMEMNTRLQVEHPVTEMVTGLDLVEWQFRVANGETLPLTQDQIQVSGHALEARIYAENPANEFLPSTGTVHFINHPSQSDSVRVDTGITGGDLVSSYYDPMISKLVVWGTDRQDAIEKIEYALDQYAILGVRNNVSFLKNLIADPGFRDQALHTRLIESRMEELLAPDGRMEEILAFSAVFVYLENVKEQVRLQRQQQDRWSPWLDPGDGFQITSCMAGLLFENEGHSIEVTVHCNQGLFTAKSAEKDLAGPFSARLVGQHILEISSARGLETAYAARSNASIYVHYQGRTAVLGYIDRTIQSGTTDDDSGTLSSPMPGTVVEVVVEEGQQVAEGERLMTIEAMKMEHRIRAPHQGTIVDIHFSAGDKVDEGASLMVIEQLGPEVESEKWRSGNDNS